MNNFLVVFLLRSVVGVKSLLFYQEQMWLLHLEGASYFGHIPQPTKIEMGDTTKNDFSSKYLTLYLHSFCIIVHISYYTTYICSFICMCARNRSQ